MPLHWVQVLNNGHIRRTDATGKIVYYNPGDWFECRTAEMLALTAAHRVRLPRYKDALKEATFEGCVVIVRGRGGDGSAVAAFREYGLCAERGELGADHPRALYYVPGLAVTPEEAALGFLRIAGDDEMGWEMAAVLPNANAILANVGEKDDQARTLEALGDLRLPVYDTRAVWVRKTEATDEMVARWANEMRGGANPAHAFVRALYTSRVRLCTLSKNWTREWME